LRPFRLVHKIRQADPVRRARAALLERRSLPLRPNPRRFGPNDDVAAASGSNSPATKSKNNSASASDTNTKPAKQLHDRLDKLEAQLRDTEKQLRDLKNFAAGEGNGTAGGQLHKGYRMEPVPDQIAKLETSRQHLQRQIDEVYDEARKKASCLDSCASQARWLYICFTNISRSGARPCLPAVFP
jgi:prefoldin subunit 5